MSQRTCTEKRVIRRDPHILGSEAPVAQRKGPDAKTAASPATHHHRMTRHEDRHFRHPAPPPEAFPPSTHRKEERPHCQQLQLS